MRPVTRMADKIKLLNNTEIFEVLQNSAKNKKVSIVNWTLTEKDDELTGFLGGYFYLKIEALIEDKPTTKNFFVKTLPASAQQSEFMQGIHLFEKEATIYSDILHAMPSDGKIKWKPNSYYTRDDVLVLDDLSTEEYKLMPSRHDFTKSHVQLVLKSLAIMHANSFYLEKEILKQPIDVMYNEVLFEVSIQRTNVWFTTGLAAIKQIALKRTKFSEDPKITHWIENNYDETISKIYEMAVKCPKKFTKVFCHRDIWRNNLMFKFDKTLNEIDFNKPLECLLIDYQIAIYMPPGLDVDMTLYLLQRNKEREDDYHENLQFYYNQFTESMKNLQMDAKEFLTYEEFIETIEYFKLLGAVLKCIFLQMTHLPEGEIDKIHANDEDYHQFIMVDRGDILINYIDTDDYFKKWIVESVEELVSMLMSDKY